jgi:hypothetical protein
VAGAWETLALGAVAAVLAATAPAGCRGAATPNGHRPALAGLMHTTLNAALTRASHALFHAEDEGAPTDPMAEVGRAAHAILEAGDALEAFADGAADPARFRAIARELQDGAAELRAAASEGARPEAMHWFEHVQATCTRCHDRFRFGAPPR